MVSFLIEHPDFNNEPIALSLYFDQFLVGSNNRCHLRFPDHQNIIYLKATQTPDKFTIESINDQFFVLNDEKFKGKLKCKVGDVIKLGMAQIKIVDMDLNKIAKGIDFKESQEYLAQNFSHMNKVISALQKELLYSDEHPK